MTARVQYIAPSRTTPLTYSQSSTVSSVKGFCGRSRLPKRLSPRAYPSAHLRDKVLSGLPDTLLSLLGFVTLADSGNPSSTKLPIVANSQSNAALGTWHVSQCH